MIAQAGPAMPMANTPPPSRSGYGEAPLRAPIWEQLLLALWFYYTFITRPNNELVLYPLALFFVGSFLLRRNVMVPLTVRSMLIFLLPILAAISWAWSPVPDTSLRFGIMWGLSGVVGIYIAGHFALHEIVRSVFLAGLATVIMVTPEMAHFGQNGPWGEKNIFAVRMVVVLLTAMAVAFNKHEFLWLRLIAAPLIPTCFIYIVIAESATSLVFGGVSILIMLIIWLMWAGLSGIRHLRTSMLLLVFTAVIGVAFVVLNNPQWMIYENILDSLGKDTTLTGRTMLWDAASRIVNERPWLGVGAEGFWLWDHGQANTLLELSHKGAGTKFSFHNSYLEVQVHLGLIGLWMLYALVAWCLWRSVMVWFQTQTVLRSFFLLITGIVFISSFTESWLYSVFDTSVTLFYVAAVSSLVRQDYLKSLMAEDAAGPPLAPIDSPGPVAGLASAE